MTIDHTKPSPEKIKVSVCLLTYNQEAYIEQAVQSALSQRTNFRFEIIIGEDCSTDRTREIVADLAAKHPEKIRLRLAPQNQGGGRNFIDLYNQSRGEYVVVLEGDDYWTSHDKLQSQADALDAHPQWAMCFHPALNVYDDGRPSHLFPEERTKSEYTIYDLLEKSFMATSAVMFRNRLFGQFPEWHADVVVGDWVLHILNADHGDIGYLPEPMSVYRIHAGGIFSQKNLEFKLVTIFKMLTKIDHHLGGKYAREIDENRLTTLRWLVGQWEHQTQTSNQAVAQTTQLSARVAALENESLLAQVARLEAECAQLRSEMQPLKWFYDTWHNSPLYRVYRETLRPWRRLRRHWQSSNSPPATTTSRAA